jgi:hypothetical protein
LELIGKMVGQELSPRGALGRHHYCTWQEEIDGEGMATIIDRIPHMTDPELLVLFENANRKLSEDGNVVAAQDAVSAVEREWKTRMDGARTKPNRSDTPAVGMLATLGYRVGATKGETTAVRRRILKHVLEGHLPMVSSPGYTDEWGLPKSTKRLSKLVQFFESQLTNPANREHEQAMIEWSEDLSWVQQNYLHLGAK